MSLQVRLDSVIKAIATDIKSINAQVANSEIIPTHVDAGTPSDTSSSLYDGGTPSGAGASYSETGHLHDYPVDSVNGRTGDVTGLAEAVHTHDYAAPTHTHDYAAPTHTHVYPVTSVNGRTGAVTGLSEDGHTHAATGDMLLSRFLRRRDRRLSGGGYVTWTGSVLAWSQRFIFIPVGTGTHININAGSVTIPAWAVAYIRLTDAELVSGGAVTKTLIVESYTAYNPQENDLLVALHNGDEGRVYLEDGRVFDYWRTATYLNNFTSYGPPTYPPAQYYKDQDGFVHLRGLINNGGAGLTVFTLPVGYRPRHPMHFPLVAAGNTGYGRIGGTIETGTGTSTQAPGNVSVNNLGGNVQTWCDLVGTPPFLAEG